MDANGNDNYNEDWLKTMSWDLGTWDAFLAHLGVTTGTPDQQRAAVAEFKALPAWQAAPADIKREAAALGA